MRKRTLPNPSWMLPGLLLASLSACYSTAGIKQPGGNPIVQIHTPTGIELGAATDYGVIFLGRKAKSGTIQFTVWYADGPSLEEGVIEPIGPDLYTTTAEIQMPVTPVSFREPRAGTRVTVRGLNENGPYEIKAVIARDPRVEGILLALNGDLADLGDDQLGAGVYLPEDHVLSLLGLVSGRLTLQATDGSTNEYITVLGPRETWRLVTHHRNRDRPRRWVHRPDIE